MTVLYKTGNMHRFDKDIVLKEEEPFLFQGTISGHWSIDGNPNGGYLMAILLNAMMKRKNNLAGFIFQVHFFSRCIPGSCSVAVESLTGSRQFDCMQAKIVQNGKERIRAIGTLANEKVNSQDHWYERTAPIVTCWEDCEMVPAMPGFTLYRHMDVALEPGCAGWINGDKSARSESKGWIKFKQERAFDMPSLLLFADSFPPPIIASQGNIGWVPTLSFSVNVRRPPESHLLKCAFRTRFVSNGFLEEDGELWDENGELVAISRQIAQLKRPDV